MKGSLKLSELLLFPSEAETHKINQVDDGDAPLEEEGFTRDHTDLSL